jgi:hypothetical protein
MGVDMLSYRAEAYISAEPRAVWKVLMDLDAYPQWDSGVSKVEGTIAHGSRIAVHRAALPGRVLHVRVTELVENLQMVWTSGRASALFRSVRTFTLKQTAGGGTEVVVEEDFRGPLTRVMKRSVPDLQPLFEQFIVGLKAQVEGHA